MADKSEVEKLLEELDIAQNGMIDDNMLTERTVTDDIENDDLAEDVMFDKLMDDTITEAEFLSENTDMFDALLETACIAEGTTMAELEAETEEYLDVELSEDGKVIEPNPTVSEKEGGDA